VRERASEIEREGGRVCVREIEIERGCECVYLRSGKEVWKGRE
jgi:hypothetical protein